MGKGTFPGKLLMCQFVKNALFHNQTKHSKSNKYRPVLIVNVHYCKINMYTCRLSGSLLYITNVNITNIRFNRDAK